MNSTERVRRTILGLEADRQPVYGWVSANLEKQLTDAYGSVEAFEDKYEFDMAHLFGGPSTFNEAAIKEAAGENDVTPEILLDIPFLPVDHTEDYENVKHSLAFHKQRSRFCYIQTPGFFEQFNGVFGIEHQLGYLCEYPEEIAELYRRQSDWTKRFASNMLDLGVDMIHISDDWGAQKNMMFSPRMWRELIYPNLKSVVDFVHSQGSLCSLHSDGCIREVTDTLADMGIDMIHPWQESAGMDYGRYLEKYSDKFAILGGICIQTTLGFGDYRKLEKEIRRVFSLLKGKRWCVCTTHFVQDHCSLDELAFAYDLITKLARS